MSGLLGAMAGAAGYIVKNDEEENKYRHEFNIKTALAEVELAKQKAVADYKVALDKDTRIAEGAEVEEAAKGLSGENAPTYDNYITAKQQRGLLTANDPHVRMKEADANREVAKQAAEDRAKHDRAMEDHYIRADATAAERAAGMLGRGRGGGGGVASSGSTKKEEVDKALNDYNRALTFMNAGDDPGGSAKMMLEKAKTKLQALGVKVGEKSDPRSTGVSAAKAILADDEASPEHKDAAREYLSSSIGGAAPGGDDKFVVGRKYKDRNGTVRTYKGNGQWG